MQIINRPKLNWQSREFDRLNSYIIEKWEIVLPFENFKPKTLREKLVVWLLGYIKIGKNDKICIVENRF